MNNPDQLTNILIMVLIGMILLLMVLAITYVFIRFFGKKKNKSENMIKEKTPVSDAKNIAIEYTKDSIFKFMDFEKIEDNMIVQKNGKKYLMAIECQGVNYDLMAEAEKVAVEEGFLQFLNTLRHPIQIYVQTRTVNLSDSIEAYKKRVEEIGIELEKKRNVYLKKLQSGQYSNEQLNKEFYEVTKQTNLYEYGKDIIANTEKMSLNKSVLNRKYYIIVPYFVEDLGGAFDKEEIRNIAFSELYMKAQSIVMALASCNVIGKIMDSNQLADLLYVAYNRDEAEVFSVDKAVRAGYEELYTTAPDVLDKEMKILDEEIERKALVMVNDKVRQVRNKKQQEIEEKRINFGDLIRERAEFILKQNQNYIGKEDSEAAIKEIQEEKEPKRKKQVTKEGGSEDVAKQAKKTRRKSANSKK